MRHKIRDAIAFSNHPDHRDIYVRVLRLKLRALLPFVIQEMFLERLLHT